MGRKEDALEYHRRGRKGKLEVVPTKPLVSQIDLSLAYTPGVAEPCLAIAKDEDMSWEYTARGNLVAVISNGTAVLGLGDIGAAAGKPVMEGKACLFKKFADIDVFDLEINEKDVDKLVDIVASLEPTFGGINLEDIASPACFEVEEKLRARMRIPVFHDDQHGTAIISGAGLINAAELAKKSLESIKPGRKRPRPAGWKMKQTRPSPSTPRIGTSLCTARQAGRRASARITICCNRAWTCWTRA